MAFNSIIALFGAMVALAMLPSPSVFAVVARSIASGFTHALVTVTGIVAGDLAFILLAIYGLSAIAELMDGLFIVVKYIGSAYLIWLGLGLWRSKAKTEVIRNVQKSSWASDFMSGLLITLSDQKAILFYMGFLPAFIDFSYISVLDALTVMAIATIAVGGVKLMYAYMADRARLLFTSPRAKQGMNGIAGSVMISTGIFLLVKT